MKNLNAYSVEYFLETLPIGKEVEITYESAKLLVKGTGHEYGFVLLNELTIDENNDFEVIQNRSYWITKTKRRGSIHFKGSQFETKTIFGIFQIEMLYDFIHPTNFSENKYNQTTVFTFGW